MAEQVECPAPGVRIGTSPAIPCSNRSRKFFLLINDTGFIRRLQQNDLAALGELYDQFAPAIFAYIYRQVGVRMLAEDLTGDVFVQTLAALRKGRSPHTSLRAWLYRVAHNRVIDHYRQNKSDLPLEEWLPDPEDVPDSTERRDEQAWVRDALKHLSDEQQQVLVLRFGEGMTAIQTAAALGKSEEAVRALQHRALGAMRRLMEKGKR